MQDKPYINEKDQVVIMPDINKAILAEQLRETFRLAPKSSKWREVYDDWTKETVPKDFTNENQKWADYSQNGSIADSDQFPAVLQDVSSLLESNEGTSIPFIANVTGSFLVNPCPVSMSTFMKMWQTDEVINRCVMQNINTIVQGVGDYHHEIPECQKIGREAIKRLHDGLRGLVETAAAASIVNGMFAGYIDKDYIERDKDGYMYPGLIRHMPELSIQFTADYKGSVNNIYQYCYNYPYAGTQNALSITGFMGWQDASAGVFGNQMGPLSIDSLASLGPMDFPFRTNFISNFGMVQLDKRFVLHYANTGASPGINPYGYSWLLPIYNLWIMKQLSRELYVSAQSRVAHPMLVGYASHNAKIQVGPTPAEQITAVQALYEAMKNHSEDSALILTGLKGQVMEIDVVKSNGNFNVFENALEYYDKRIETGLKVPGGSFDSGSSYAGVTAQGSVYMRNMSKYRYDIVSKLVLNQYMRWVLQHNYDPNINDFGMFDTEAMDIDDKLKYVKLYAQMIEMGAMSNMDAKTIKIIGRQMGMPGYDKTQLDLIIKENYYNLVSGEGKAKGKDTTKKQDVSSAGEHYKSQGLTDKYEEASGVKK